MEGNVDSKLFEAIGFFEKMLQTMPDDRTSLEFLAVAYEQVGEQDKQIKTLIKLSETLLKEGDADHAAIIAKKLKSFVAVPEALSAARVAEMLLSKGSFISAPRVTGPISNQLFIDAKDHILADVKQEGVQEACSLGQARPRKRKSILSGIGRTTVFFPRRSAWNCSMFLWTIP